MKKNVARNIHCLIYPLKLNIRQVNQNTWFWEDIVWEDIKSDTILNKRQSFAMSLLNAASPYECRIHSCEVKQRHQERFFKRDFHPFTLCFFFRFKKTSHFKWICPTKWQTPPDSDDRNKPPALLTPGSSITIARPWFKLWIKEDCNTDVLEVFKKVISFSFIL